MTIGKPFKKGQSGNPGGRPKVAEPCKTPEEWVASLGDRSSPTQSNGSAAQQGEAT